MGNGYDHHYFHRKTMFLPIFCRLSIKDIKLNNNNHRKLDRISDEPSSPKVSCMGQVKRNNRITGFPSTITTTNAVATHHHKYSKLKRLFSGKTLLPYTTPKATCTSSKEIVSVNNSAKLKMKNDGVKVVSVKELDPPLPVVKRVAPPQGVEVNIWKRRFNGVALKGLQIEQIHNLPNCSISQPPTV